MKKIRQIPRPPKAGEIKRAPALRKGRRFSYPEPPPRPDPLEAAALQGVPGSLPERIVWKWLESEKRRYLRQRLLLGEQLLLGTTVADFVILDWLAKPIVLAIFGDYYHGPGFPERMRRDKRVFQRLIRQGYHPVILWESAIYEAVRAKRLTAYITGEILGPLRLL